VSWICRSRAQSVQAAKSVKQRRSDLSAKSDRHGFIGPAGESHQGRARDTFRQETVFEVRNDPLPAGPGRWEARGLTEVKIIGQNLA